MYNLPSQVTNLQCLPYATQNDKNTFHKIWRMGDIVIRMVDWGDNEKKMVVKMGKYQDRQY